MADQGLEEIQLTELTEEQIRERKAMDVNFLLKILESSDSSGSEDEIAAALSYKMRHDHPKNKKFVNEVVYNYSEEEFRRNFRLNRATCDNLITSFEDSNSYPKAIHGRKQISAETHILSFLWYAGNKSVIRDVASRFGISESSFHRQMQRVINFLVELAPLVIKFPTTSVDKQKLEENFREISGFPGVIGCVDSSHFNIRTPAHKMKSTFVNQHDTPAITLQGICDHERKFLDVFTGIPSKIHDSRVFRLSFIHKDLPSICGDKYHILGDEAYPIREWCLTPYLDYGNMTVKQTHYNACLTETRIVIEKTFRTLKKRFRQLFRTDFFDVDKTAKFILACCVLHNICINCHDLWIEDDDKFDLDNFPPTSSFEEEPDEESQNGKDEILKRLGEEKRDRICQMFVDV